MMRSVPSTPLGRWSVSLGVLFLLLFLINTTVFMPTGGSMAPWRPIFLPFYGITMMAVGLAAGVTGTIAVTRSRERSWLVWVPLLVGLFVVVFLLGEILVPH